MPPWFTCLQRCVSVMGKGRRARSGGVRNQRRNQYEKEISKAVPPQSQVYRYNLLSDLLIAARVKN
eukprot:scaffold36060_cov68-Cyclotella_meneghiniana.AAC.6